MSANFITKEMTVVTDVTIVTDFFHFYIEVSFILPYPHAEKDW